MKAKYIATASIRPAQHKDLKNKDLASVLVVRHQASIQLSITNRQRSSYKAKQTEGQ